MTDDEPLTGSLDHDVALLPVARLGVIQEVLLTHHLHGVDTSSVLMTNKLDTTEPTLTDDFNQIKIGIFGPLGVNGICYV